MKKLRRVLVLAVVLAATFVPVYKVLADTADATTATTSNPYSNPGKVTDDIIDTSANLLGVASQFHIFADSVSLHAHTDGNIATNNLDGSASNFGTNALSSVDKLDVYYIKNLSSINGGSFVSGNQTKAVFGSTVTIDKSTNQIKGNGNILGNISGNSVYTDSTDSYLDVDAVLDELSSTATTLAANETTDGVTLNFDDQNKRTIDLSGVTQKGGIVTVNLTADQLSTATPLYITGVSTASGYTVVFNVSGDLTAVNSEIHLNVDGVNLNASETSDYSKNVVLWNFGNTTNTISINRVFQGSVLAPKATVNVTQNLNGNIVAKNVSNTGETHRWDLQPTKQVTTSSTTDSTTSVPADSSSTTDSTTSDSTTDSTTSSTSDSSTTDSTTSSTSDSSTTDSTTSSTSDSSTTDSSSTTNTDSSFGGASSSDSTTDSTSSSNTGVGSTNKSSATPTASATTSGKSTTQSGLPLTNDLTSWGLIALGGGFIAAALVVLRFRK